MKKPAASSLTASALKRHNSNHKAAETTTTTTGLDSKLVAFQKKGGDITDFLGSLSKEEREACWKRYEYGRKEDPEAEKTYKEVATGPGSQKVKESLLAAFIKNKCSVKGQSYIGAAITFKKDNKLTTSESWKPFEFMKNYYGVPELMRRVKNKSIAARQDTAGEWEFKLVQVQESVEETNSHGFKAKFDGKLDNDKMSQLLKDAGIQGKSSPALKFLQDQVPKSQLGQTTKEAMLGEDEENGDDVGAGISAEEWEIDRLSDLGSIGKATKQRAIDAVKIISKALVQQKGTDFETELKKHKKKLEKLRTGGSNLEQFKTALIEAMQCVKKSMAKK